LITQRGCSQNDRSVGVSNAALRNPNVCEYCIEWAQAYRMRQPYLKVVRLLHLL
jgi:hypothetical protein